MSQEIVPQQTNGLAHAVKLQQMAQQAAYDLQNFADAAFKSGLFKSVSNVAQAIVKIQMGRELGIPPMRAMQSIYIVHGNITMNGTLLGALIKQSGRYTYRVTRMDNNACTIDFYEISPSGGDYNLVGQSTFSIEDAQRAGLHTKDNWRNYPRNMLFNRAISNGARWYCPDIFIGPIYTPDEMDMAVDAKGDVIDEEVRTPDRDGWQREAAAAIYPKVSDEVVEHIKLKGRDTDVSRDDFTRLLKDIAATHAIALPKHPDDPDGGVENAIETTNEETSDAQDADSSEEGHDRREESDGADQSSGD